jgi:hypothetical protein
VDVQAFALLDRQIHQTQVELQFLFSHRLNSPRPHPMRIRL